jgi:hypothetical protein
MSLLYSTLCSARLNWCTCLYKRKKCRICERNKTTTAENKTILRNLFMSKTVNSTNRYAALQETVFFYIYIRYGSSWKRILILKLQITLHDIVEKLVLRHKIFMKAWNLNFTINNQVPVNSSIIPSLLQKTPSLNMNNSSSVAILFIMFAKKCYHSVH